MAAISSNEILRTIRKNGYWVSDNPAIGKRVDAVLIPRIDLQTAEALELLKASAFDDELNQEIISTVFTAPVLVFFRGFGQTRRVHCFRNNLKEIPSETSLLVLALCSTNTRLALFEDSHDYQLNATNAPNGVLAVPDERINELVHAGKIIRREEVLEEGGYIWNDGRTGWRVLQGKVAFVGIYVPTDAAINWARMPIPKDEVRMRLMDEMRHKSGSLCSRFEWVNVA